MNVDPEVIEQPLTPEALAERYRALCEDPRFANLPGKLELDAWGQMIFMSPASNYHGLLQARLSQRLAVLGGETVVEASILTPRGLLVADLAWGSPAFVAAHGAETPFTRAPEICIEIASPTNSLRALRDKTQAYLGVGAVEAWIVFPRSRRFELHGASAPLAESAFPVDLAGLFD